MNVGVIHPSISTFRGGANSQCKRCEDAAAVSLNMEQSSLFLAKSAIEQMKRSAKRVVKSQNISHAQALDLQAQQHGYSRWSLLQRHVKKMHGVKPGLGISDQIDPLSAENEESKIMHSESLNVTLGKDIAEPTKATPVVAVPTSTEKNNSQHNLKKEPKPPKEKKPKWLSAKSIGDAFALTLPKVRASLMCKGYLDENNTPTQKAFDENVVQVKMIKSRYTDSAELVPFYLWLESFVDNTFNPPNELDLYCHITNRFDIESKMVAVFQRASDVLNIEAIGKPSDMPKYEYICLTSPCGMLGGMIAVAHPPIGSVMEKYEQKLEPVISGIATRLAKVNPDEAYFFKTACTRIFDWAKKR